MKRFLRGAVCAVLLVSLLCSLALFSSAAELKTAVGIVTANGGLRLRSEANTSSRILATAHRGDTVVIIARVGDWFRVNYNLQSGYMYADYLNVKEKENVELGVGSVDASLVNLRSGPSTATTALAQLAAGETVSIFGFNCGWYKVRCNSFVGYLRSDLVALTEKPYGNFGSTGTADFGRTTGQQLTDYAKQFVGYPYIYGGSSPSGFDCSGFMQYVFAQFGYTINRTATAQLNDGVSVGYDEMQPGDIVYFGYGNTATHVGMYIGDGQFVHAQNSATGVVVSSLSESYYASRYLCAHRITG